MDIIKKVKIDRCTVAFSLNIPVGPTVAFLIVSNLICASDTYKILTKIYIILFLKNLTYS